MFKREKETILKIVNLILLIWLVASVSILYSQVVALYMKEPVMTKDEYNCSDYYQKDTAEPVKDPNLTEEQCTTNYNQYLTSFDSRDLDLKRGMFMALGSVVIVSTAIYFLNRKKED